MTKIFALSTVVALLMCCGLVNAETLQLNEKPRQKAAKVRLKSTHSMLHIPMTLPLEQLRQQIELLVPQTVYTIDERRTGPCVDLVVTNKCISYDVNGQVTRHGEIKVSGQGSQIEMQLPLAAQFNVKGVGSLEAVSQSAQGVARVKLMVDIRLSPNWQTDIKLDISHQWDEAFHIELAGVKISLRSIADEAINQQLNQLEQQLQQQLKQQFDLKAIATRGWQQAQQPFALNQDLHLWLGVEPQKVYLQYVGVKDGVFILDSLVKVKSQAKSFTKPPQAPSVKDLPDLAFGHQAKGKKPTFDLRLPFGIDYQQLADQFRSQIVKHIANQALTHNDKTVEILAVNLYPYGRRLVMGLDLGVIDKMQVSQSLGKVFFQANVKIDTDKQQLRLTDVAYTRIKSTLDNQQQWFWSAAFAPLTERLLTVIISNGFYDYRPLVTELTEKSQQAVWFDEVKGLTVSGHLSKMRLYKVILTDKGLVVDAGFKGQVKATVAIADFAQHVVDKNLADNGIANKS